MEALAHVGNLIGVSHYQAPDSVTITPFQIKPGGELVELITDGGVWFEVDGEDRPFGAGSIFWHCPGDLTIHRSLPNQPYRCMCFSFEADAVPERIAPRVSQWADARESVDFCWEAFNAFRSGQWSNRTLGLILYTRLLWESRRAAPPDRSGLPAPVLRAMTYIERQVGNPLPLEELANAAGVSVPHLHALFRSHLDTTPHRALEDRRMVHARTLLATTAQSVKTVSRECGFGHVETFCRAFRKRYAQTPTEFRLRESGR